MTQKCTGATTEACSKNTSLQTSFFFLFTNAFPSNLSQVFVSNVHKIMTFLAAEFHVSLYEQDLFPK